MKIMFCQFDTRLINRDIKPDIADEFYRTFWDKKEIDGFYKYDKFWEIPLWIAEMCHNIPDSWDKELHVISDVENSVKYLKLANPDIICFSCLDVNKEHIDKITKNLPLDINKAIGGYVKPEIITDHRHFSNWFDNIAAFCKSWDIPYLYGTDYSLFSGYKCIPRLALSTGCKHKCKFCCIEDEIVELSDDDIMRQIKSLSDLDFRLVYLNDKTFGQAKNYKHLRYINNSIKTIRPDFDGFIIQTTCNQLCKPGFIQELKEFNVRYVELGIESCNDTILQKYSKPQSETLIHRALKLCNDNSINVIPNIMIGLPGETKETYENTLSVLRQYDIYSLNIYNLAIYENAALSDEIEASDNDSNELVKDKSYHSKQDRENIEYFYEKIFDLGLSIL